MSDLNGAPILVTRPEHQAEKLCQLLSVQGARVVRFPTLAIEAVNDIDLVQATLANLGKFQWLIFTSANAVNFALNANGGKIPRFDLGHIAAIGQASAQALADAGMVVDVVPKSGFSSEALLSEPQLQSLDGQHILIIRGEGGREELAAVLSQRGANVHYLEVYQRKIPLLDNAEILALIADQQLAAITITSGDALQNLFKMIQTQWHPALVKIPVIVVSARIADMAEDMGFNQIVVAEQPADTAILKAVTMCLMGK